MLVTFILCISIIIQLATAVLALRLIRITGIRSAWILISSAIILMVIRRFLTLLNLINNNFTYTPDLLRTELVAILISTLMVTGIALIAPLFNSVQHMQDELKKHRDYLEGMVQERMVELETINKQLQNEIIEHHETESALRDSEERYRQIIELSPYLIAIHYDGKFVFINKSGSEILGAANPQEIIGKPIIGFIHPDFQKTINDRIKYLQEKKKNVVPLLAQKFVRLDGTTVDVEIMALNITFQGKPAVKIIGNTVTERKLFEKEMKRLESLNLIGQMAAGIGHEIRNPMTTVRGFLQMLGSKKDCIQYKEYYDLMIEELDRANSIITGFLSLAKNKMIERKIQNLNSIVKSIYPLIHTDAMLTNKNIKAQLEDIPNLILDAHEIRQLILNLVRNGLEAMDSGGNLTIRTFLDKDNVVLSVQDQGRGINEEVLDKLGTPFYTTKDNGTGLGLAVCYSIAARHDATVDVETSPSGTTFYFRFKNMTNTNNVPS